MFYYKIHRSAGKTLLAACDEEILGKRFEDGNLVLDIKEGFYRGEKAGNEVVELFQKADIINIAGNKIISLAIKGGWVSKKGIIKVKGTPHAQVFVL